MILTAALDVRRQVRKDGDRCACAIVDDGDGTHHGAPVDVERRQVALLGDSNCGSGPLGPGRLQHATDHRPYQGGA